MNFIYTKSFLFKKPRKWPASQLELTPVSTLVLTGVNPFTQKSDKLQISPAASALLTVWLFIAYSDER